VLSQLFRGNDLFTSMFTAQMGVVNYSRSLENHKPFRSCSRPSSKGRAQRLATARRASPPGPKARPAGALPARGQASGSARKSVLLPQGSPAGEKLQFCAAIQSAAASSTMLAHRPPSRSSPSSGKATVPARDQPTMQADPEKVRKLIEKNYKTPNDLKIPHFDGETASLEIVVHPSDLICATEVVATAVEQGVVKNITVIGDIKSRNGTVSMFFRRKTNVREKALLHALQKDKYIPLVSLKLCGVLKAALTKEQLVTLELVGLRHLSPESLSLLAQGLEENKSLSALCFNDSTLGDKGLQRLVPVIRDHKGLTRLQLCRTSITDVSGRDLMEMLHTQVIPYTLPKPERLPKPAAAAVSDVYNK